MVDSSVVARLAALSTPSVLNGLKRLGVAPQELESTDRSAIRCMSPGLGVSAGWAVTVKMRSSGRGDASGVAHNAALTRRLHDLLLAPPGPKVLVVENVGEPEGPACVWGEVMANVYHALGCSAGITNGPVRDLPEMEEAGFQTFAGGLAVGGGFLETIEVGGAVSVGGLAVRTGDLLHGDMHGVLKIPTQLAAEIPAAVRAVEEFERRVVDLCRSPGFSPEALAGVWTTGRH